MDDTSSGDRDWSFSPEINWRHDYVNELANHLLQGSGEQVRAVGEMCTYRVGPDGLLRIEGPDEVELMHWAFRLADFLFNARATLDNVAWQITHDGPLVELTERQGERIYFPIRPTAESWASFRDKPHGKAIRSPLIERLESVQPFANPGTDLGRALLYLHELHNVDKHRYPLGLELHPDRQMPIVLGPGLGAAYGRDDSWIEWLDGWDLPLSTDRPLARVSESVRSRLQPTSIVALVPMTNLGGVRYDLQDLVYDVQGAVTRVIDTVCLGDTARSELWDGHVAVERARVADLKRDLTEGTDDWSLESNPYPAVYDELARRATQGD